MENRARILQAAADVYAEYGFRGATTRRIAAAAGVNEVTLFRIFGSKEALLGEAIKCCGIADEEAPLLPAEPVDPERELTAWSREHLTRMRDRNSLIRTMMGELDARPELVPAARVGPTCACTELREYLGRLRRRGLVDPDLHVTAAAASLLGALFADAMGRDMMPDVFPQPAEAAPRLYTKLFLRAIGAVPAVRRRDARSGPRLVKRGPK